MVGWCSAYCLVMHNDSNVLLNNDGKERPNQYLNSLPLLVAPFYLGQDTSGLYVKQIT